MRSTKNELNEKIRTKVIALLTDRLADAIDLVYQVKQAHWNVKGPNFIALHELFDEVATHATEFADLIAERIVQLGGTARGTIRAAVENSSLPEYPLDLVAGRDHVDQLSTSLAHFGNAIHEGILSTNDLDDPTTADLLTEISRDVDKDMWFVESHLDGAGESAVESMTERESEHSGDFEMDDSEDEAPSRGRSAAKSKSANGSRNLLANSDQPKSDRTKLDRTKLERNKLEMKSGSKAALAGKRSGRAETKRASSSR